MNYSAGHDMHHAALAAFIAAGYSREGAQANVNAIEEDQWDFTRRAIMEPTPERVGACTAHMIIRAARY